MRTNIPEKLLNIVEEIDEHGNASLTRLTVLKKWLERPERLSAFAIWVAARATSRKGKWGVSIQAMVQRAKTLELISEETYKRHCRNISARGWRSSRAEPLDETVPSVNRTLGKMSLELLKKNEVMKTWDISSELPLPSCVFKSVFGQDIKPASPLSMINFRLDRDLFDPPTDSSTLN
jgi:hypothetical protein